MKNTTKSTMYIVQELCSQELHIFFNHLELNYKSFYFDVIPSHQYFYYFLELNIFYGFSFYNLNILQYHMIYRIHIHNC